jgi:hypothetical protein
MSKRGFSPDPPQAIPSSPRLGLGFMVEGVIVFDLWAPVAWVSCETESSAAPP